MSFRGTKASLLVCLPAALVLFLLSPLDAADVTLNVQVGFHGLFQLGRPFPLRIEVVNQGPPIEGTVEATVWKGGAAKGVGALPVFHRRQLFVGAEARKTVAFTVDPGSISRPLVVGFRGAGFKVNQEIDLRRYFTPSALILLLTESNLPSALPLSSGAANPVVAASVGELPSDARAYAGVAAIVLYEPSVRDLSNAQSVALDAWLASGGKIVVLGSMHYALYQEPALSRFLPVRVTGLKSFAALPGLQKAYAASALTNIPAQEAKVVEGKSVIEAEGAPILVEAGRARGKILYLALDVGRPPLAHWDGLGRLFRDLLAPAGESERTPPPAWDEAIFSQLLAHPGLMSAYVPVRAFFFWMIFYLVGLGILTWLWQGRRLGWRTLGGSFVALVIFVAGAGYFHFSRGGKIPDGVLVTSTLLESLADGYVEASSNVALFSTLRRDYELVVDKGWTDFEPVARRSARAEDDGLVVEEEGGTPRFRTPLKEWDYRLFRARSVSRFPVRVELETEPNTRRLTVTNQSAKDLTECWMILAGERVSLGEIPSGASRVREFPFTATRAEGPSDLREIRFQDPMRELLLRASFFPQEQRRLSGAALFFGWVSAGPRGVSVADEKVLARDFTLFRAVLPLGEEEE
ncbi:MAG TPA: hypothetical protein VGL11_21430 [Candidatus Binatia bacterium]|jgi:hypothetical protein